MNEVNHADLSATALMRVIPGRLSPRGPSARGAWLALVLLLATFGLAAGRAEEKPVMWAHFINVGQADCTLLEFPCGAVLIDAGAENLEYRERLISYLDSFFERRSDLNRTLACVFITHQHKDHTSALKAIAGRFTIERYIENGERSGGGAEDTTWLESEVEAGRQTAAMHPVRDSDITALSHRDGLNNEIIDPLRCPTCDPVIRVLSGGMDTNPGWPNGDFENPNNHSLVIRVGFGESSFLFTGDLQEYAIDTLVDYYDGTNSLNIDVYQVGHHGSHNATTGGFLRAMTPQIAVISMGHWVEGRLPNGNARPMSAFGYGHPRRNILDLLSQRIPGYRSRRITIMASEGSRDFSEYEVRKRIYATGWEGTIKVRVTLDRGYTTYAERGR